MEGRGGEGYRDELAKDLKKLSDHEERRAALEAAKNTKEYQEAKLEHVINRDTSDIVQAIEDRRAIAKVIDELPMRVDGTEKGLDAIPEIAKKYTFDSIPGFLNEVIVSRREIADDEVKSGYFVSNLRESSHTDPNRFRPAIWESDMLYREEYLGPYIEISFEKKISDGKQVEVPIRFSIGRIDLFDETMINKKIDNGTAGELFAFESVLALPDNVKKGLLSVYQSDTYKDKPAADLIRTIGNNQSEKAIANIAFNAWKKQVKQLAIRKHNEIARKKADTIKAQCEKSGIKEIHLRLDGGSHLRKALEEAGLRVVDHAGSGKVEF
jgi:hypothetical protein